MANAPSIDAFVNSLVEKLALKFPVAIANDANRKMSPDRVSAILEDCLSSARQYVVESKLGWFGKARLGNAFRWKLAEVGYNKEFVEVATEGLIVYTTSKLK